MVNSGKSLVSVVMAAYNEEEYLGEGIDSILAQSYKNIELVLIDDASTDETPKIMRRYADTGKISDVKILKNDTNCGLTPSLNKGIDQARGKYIARMDADDVSFPERLEYQISRLEDNPGIWLCGTDGAFIDSEGRELTEINGSSQDIEEILPKKNPFIHSSICFKNDGIKYREKFKRAQDYDLYLRLLTQKKRMEILDRVLVKRRTRVDTVTRTFSAEQSQFSSKAKEFYFQREKFGTDNYADFDPKDEILNSSTKTSNREAAQAKKLFKLYLKSNRSNLARQSYKEWRKHVEGYDCRLVLFPIFLKFPSLFKLYELASFIKMKIKSLVNYLGNQLKL